MTRQGLHLFTWSGARTFVHPTFLLLPGLFVLPDLVAGETMDAMTSLWLILASFASITLHEYGHIFMARGRGARTGDVSLHLFGGLASIGPDMGRGRDEVLIALAGPAVNLALAAICSAVLAIVRTSGSLGSLVDQAVFGLAAVNLIILIFNMLPLFPMDGGRVLRGSLRGLIGKRRGTYVAVTVGWLIGAALAVYAVMNGLYLLVGLVLFMMIAGAAELHAIRQPEGDAQAA